MGRPIKVLNLPKDIEKHLTENGYATINDLYRFAIRSPKTWEDWWISFYYVPSQVKSRCAEFLTDAEIKETA